MKYRNITSKIILTILIFISIHYVKLTRTERRNMMPRLKEVSTDQLVNIYGNETQKSELLEETKINLIKEFGLRKNMLTIGTNLRRRMPHKFMRYLVKHFKDLRRTGKAAAANTIRGCTDLGNQRRKLVPFRHISFKFDVSEIPKDELTIFTELKVLMKVPKDLRHNSYTLTLYDVLPRRKDGAHKEPKLYRLRHKVIKIVPGQSERWITIDATESFLLAKSRNKKHVKLVLKAQPEGGLAIDPTLIGLNNKHAEETDKALLVIYGGDFSDAPARRRRRAKRGVSSPEQSKKSQKRRRKNGKKRKSRKNRNKKNRKNRKACRRKNMEVDFHQFGWTNWLFSPTKYNAYYCHGQCMYPIPSHLEPTNHAIIQSMMHDVERKIAPQPCCVPDEFEVLPFLLLDGSDRVVFKLKEGLIVKSCSCR